VKALVRTLALLVAAATGAAAADDPVWQALPLPGGVAGLARAAGLDAHTERWRVLYETSRRLHPTYGDPADTARLRQRVRAQLHDAAPRLARGPEPPSPGRLEALPDAAGGGSANRTVSLPLPVRLWRTAVLDRRVPDDGLVEALLEDRVASLVCRGLFQLDDPTLRFLAGRPKLVSWIRHSQAGVFSVFAGSLRVRDGRVVVPGGTEAEPLWAEALGVSPAQAEPFLRELLARGDGRMAFLFHTLDLLEPATQRFALGQAGDDPKSRRQGFRGLATAFGQGPPWWRPEAGAFARALVDPAVVLHLVRVEADGRPAPPASRAFWEVAFSGGIPAKVEALAREPLMDAAWLVENVGLASTPEQRRERLTQVAFAQRVFGTAAPGDLRDVLLAVRGLARFPALVLVLDRMDIGKPALYAHAIERADDIAQLGTDRRALAALAQYQGAIALLDRARFAHTLGMPEVESLVASLAEVPLTGGGYAGGVARWIEEHLLPALAPLVDADPSSGSAEGTLLGALAGDRLSDPAPPPFEWEGLWYRAQPGIGERRRLRAVRQRQGGNALDTVLAFSRAAQRSQARPDSESRTRLQEAARLLDTSTLSPDDRRDLKTLDAGSSRRAQALVQAADELLAETLTALAYAPHLGSAQGTALAGASVAGRHEFGPHPWELPEEVLGTGAPWRVRGSLLGLDLALARLSLRRLTAEVPSHAPGLDPRMGLAFARTAVWRSPFAMRDDEAKAIAEGITRGRERAAGAIDAGVAAVLGNDAGLDPWRARGLRSVLTDEPGAASGFFTLAELLRLGRPNLAGDVWGTPDLARGGSLRLFAPPGAGYDDLLGQRLENLFAGRLQDLVLRVAVELDARRLPARLVPGILTFFVQDFVQEAMPTASDDWLTLARYARDAPSERFDEYVSALVGDGPLVPAPDPVEPSKP
jgi:hypothetical protein